MIGKASGLPEVATVPIASSVSENSSLANLATASSNGPASAGDGEGSDQEDGEHKRAKTIKKIGRHFTTPAGVKEGGDIAAFRSLVSLLEVSSG